VLEANAHRESATSFPDRLSVATDDGEAIGALASKDKEQMVQCVNVEREGGGKNRSNCERRIEDRQNSVHPNI
jgi:hypothetical protein